MNKTYDFEWSDLAFASKKPLRDLKAAFIAAPRDISAARFKQLVKEFLPVGNVVLGVAKESYIDGFEGQPQFRTLQLEAVQPVIDLINKASNQHKVYTLSYAQRELPYLFEKSLFRRAVLVNGSWKQTFHTQPAYYALMRQGTPYDLVPAFASEQEARDYETRAMPEIAKLHSFQSGPYTEAEMLAKASEAAVYSFDYSHQTGVVLGLGKGKKYELLGWAYNRVVPFQTYALYYGASREANFSPPHDLNHYDTLHAEVEMIVQAQKRGLDLHGTTLFINLLPCPACARMFTETDIDEFVYSIDHSEGYAVKMLEAAGKKVRRVVL